MNYQRIYDAIVSRSRTRDTPERVEKHHIIPRCLGGGNEPENIVKVTPREHFILHLILVRLTSGVARSKMASAVLLMIKNTNKRLGRANVTSRRYDASRFYHGAVFSEEHRRKLSEAAKRRAPETYVRSEAAKKATSETMKGRVKSHEHLAKIAASQRGKKRESWGQHSEETKQAISAIHAGKPKSEEHKAKLRESQLGTKRAPWTEERRTKFEATILARKHKVQQP